MGFLGWEGMQHCLRFLPSKLVSAVHGTFFLVLPALNQTLQVPQSSPRLLPDVCRSDATAWLNVPSHLKSKTLSQIGGIATHVAHHVRVPPTVSVAVAVSICT